MDEEPGVLGRLPATRPQHRSRRRPEPTSAATAASDTAAATDVTTTADASPGPVVALVPAADAADATPAGPGVPEVPRSGWATPVGDHPSSPGLPPLVAVADGALRVGERLVRGFLRLGPNR